MTPWEMLATLCIVLKSACVVRNHAWVNSCLSRYLMYLSMGSHQTINSTHQPTIRSSIVFLVFVFYFIFAPFSCSLVFSSFLLFYLFFLMYLCLYKALSCMCFGQKPCFAFWTTPKLRSAAACGSTISHSWKFVQAQCI